MSPLFDFVGPPLVICEWSVVLLAAAVEELFSLLEVAAEPLLREPRAILMWRGDLIKGEEGEKRRKIHTKFQPLVRRSYARK